MKAILKKLTTLFATVVFVGALTGCDATFDASSKAALSDSMDKVTKEMDLDEKRALRHAFNEITTHFYNKHRREGLAGFTEADLEVQDAIDGKTAKQVIALAEELRDEG